MDFEKVLPLIIQNFEKEGISYALIGGFAIGILGIARATVDLDFLVLQQDLPKIENIMLKYNYRCVFKTNNVSQYVSELKIFGEIDFLHAFRKISLSMLKRAKVVSVFEGELKVKVLIPEDIIGLKLQALVNDPSKENREYADIEAIMEHFRKNLDWILIKDYFSLFKKDKKFNDLKNRYG
jgi:hypothetical protein